MPRFFFHLRNGKPQDDADGLQLANIRAARLAAIRKFGELIAAQPEDFDRGHDWRMEIMDGNGLLLFRIDLDLMLVASPSVPDP